MPLRLKRLWIVTLAPFSAALSYIAQMRPGLTERFFSRGLYRALTESYGRVFGFIPFSAAQFLIVLLPILAAAYVTRKVWIILKKPEQRRRAAARFSVNAVCALCVAWFMFTVLCGLNYSRESYAASAGLDARGSDAEELALLYDELVSRVNECSSLVTRNGESQTAPDGAGTRPLAARVKSVFGAAAENRPQLAGFVPLPKPVLYSRLMSYADITGMYFPFTMEANVNADVCSYLIPASMAHELAHVKGYMREDEANYIAYLVCAESGIPELAYSGLMLALSHTSGQLWRADPEAYMRITGGLAEAVLADLSANREYWKRFEGPVAEFSNSANDSYLKMNRQRDGIQSYGRMVDLLLAERRARLDAFNKP